MSAVGTTSVICSYPGTATKKIITAYLSSPAQWIAGAVDGCRAGQRQILNVGGQDFGDGAIVFGVLAFIWPGPTLFTLVIFYGAFALVDGVLAIAAAIMGGAPAPRWWLAIVGVLGIAVGLMTFVWPGITALVLLFFIAGWAIAIGIMQIVGAIRLRKEIEGEWLLIAGGVLSVLFGIGILIWPGAGALALILVIGAYAIVFGIILVIFSLRLRKHGHEPAPAH